MTKEQLIAAVLTAIVPYLTTLLKVIWDKVLSGCPLWLKPFRPWIVSAVIASISKYFGVALPSDVMQLTDANVTSILTSTVMMGLIAGGARDSIDTMKAHWGPETIQGKLLRAISGAHDDDGKSIPPTGGAA